MKTKLVKVDEVEVESLIKKNFTKEFMRKIYDIYSDDCMSIVEKTILFDKLFTEEFGDRKDYRRIGEGTNRFVCLLDNHIIKVAYNYLAYIDNMNELAQAKYKKKYLAQAYETNGLILVSEYVTVMDKAEFLENQLAISRILLDLEADRDPYSKEKEKYYILGDMGMSNKNYGNWGRRMNGDIVVLDYGYLYQLSYKEWKEVSKCPVCGSSLSYTEDYSELYCEKSECKTRVKYTTLRNNFGYSNIIENIKYNLNNDKYIKFDKNGKITVDVMEKVKVEEEKEEDFKIPEDIENKINKSMEKYFEIAEYVKANDRLDVYDIEMIKEEIYNEENEYDEILLPYVISSLELNYQNVDKYLNDFNKVVKARYNELFTDLKREYDNNKVDEMLKEDNEPDIYEPTEGYNINGYESNVKTVDKYQDSTRKLSSLDELLGSEVGDTFKNLFMIGDNDKLDEIETENSYTLDHIMGLLNANEQYKDDVIDEVEEESEEDIENELKEAYDNLEDALTSLITDRYKLIGRLEESEDDYNTGDIYRTYLNGDCIDLDYSPRVNAKNILGGWEPNKFAFPLYRHMLIKYDYDVETIDEEYEAVYRIEEEVEIPEDIYSKIENRSIVIGQLLTRFEEDIRPPRYIVIDKIGRELNEYYEALDKYYESVKETKTDVGYEDPDYYLKLVENTESVVKLLREAKSELRDELLDDSIRLEDMLKDHKIVYYYDIEAIMSNTELNLYDIIKSNKFINRKGEIFNNIKDILLNKYYMEYGSVLSDSVFDIFKYGGSIEKEFGCNTHPRIMKPRIKARLVSKDSNEDTFKPDVFNKLRYTRVVIEQRYELLINKNNSDESSKYSELKLSMNRKNIYYTESNISLYNIKKSKDNMKYGLTDKEIELVNEYERMLGTANVNDNDKLFKKSIVEVLCRRNNLSDETKEFMNDLYKYDLSEAYANRLFKINILEISGSMNRLDFLKQVEA